ncbi:phosphate/phosphite/phosphonate ABC transporter substrate-binding protein [Argonema galeatum]|uniref:phosphate/phosphite/phosphonate ABC transporter substrate-binding protein n=1 Tax=Argonema galeatum TaxID=2942762 RepID=UPI002011670C|nr:phosphate/phosphite/phosphonate ABC transporter substrate-binding protein [Argonema galeatum]MCL1466836.1 phosphate/phosphite/phosphonate ABC transporter substrate-binding protein [Argonema galeatum A003/A1]
MLSRRLLLAQILMFLAGCASVNDRPGKNLEKLIIGVVSDGEGPRSTEKYDRLIAYLESQTRTLIELEPAYNEIKAVEQIKRQNWDLAFASPGLAAIAIAKAQYLPLFPLQGISSLQSVFAVLNESRIKQLADLARKKVALGQPGSATGYYVPLNELRGTTLAEVRLAPTPRTVLEWIAKGEVAAGALSREAFDRYRSEFSSTNFRIIHASPKIPAGAVLIGPKVERNQQELIKKVMSNVSPELAQEAGYIPNAKAPNYDSLIALIQKVESLEARLQKKPVRL